jgi:hypothetical protein
MEISAREGKIWDKRPVVSANGLVSTILNRKKRVNAEVPQPFRDVAFGHGFLNAATVDSAGRIVAYDFVQNKYRHVKHAGSGGVRIVFSAAKTSDVVVSFEDATVGPAHSNCV